MSYFEVYNEGIFDLLDPSLSNTQLEVRQNKEKGIFIQNLTTVQVENLAQAKELYEKGEQKRRYAVTNMNHNSSRSHVVLQLNIKSRFLTLPVRTNNSILMMADLAGSECIEKSKTTGLGQREGSLINKSLLSLSNIITKLNNNDGFVSFRESKLTRILQPVLTENSVTVVICTVNPCKEHLQESLNTLRFGTCAGGVKMKNKIVLPEKATPRKGTVNLEEEIEKLNALYNSVKSELIDTKEGFTNTELELRQEREMNSINQAKIANYILQVEELKSQIEVLKVDRNKYQNLFVDQEEAIEVWHNSEHQKEIIQLKANYEGEITRLKLELLEQIQSNNATNTSQKLKKKLKDLHERLMNSEKENRRKDAVIKQMRDEIKNFKLELEQADLFTPNKNRKLVLPSILNSVNSSALGSSGSKSDFNISLLSSANKNGFDSISGSKYFNTLSSQKSFSNSKSILRPISPNRNPQLAQQPSHQKPTISSFTKSQTPEKLPTPPKPSISPLPSKQPSQPILPTQSIQCVEDEKDGQGEVAVNTPIRGGGGRECGAIIEEEDEEGGGVLQSTSLHRDRIQRWTSRGPPQQ